MFDNARRYVLDNLDLPAEWKVVEEQRLPDTIDRETVVVRHLRVERLKAAPLGSLEHELVLGVFVPNRDLAKAEERLDRAVTELLTDLDGHPSIKWTEAEKVVTPHSFPGWEITLSVTTQKSAS